MLKKSVKILAIILSLMMIVFIPFCYFVIEGSDVSKAIELNYEDHKGELISFEEGALLLKDKFKAFRNFSSDKRYWNKIEEKLTSLKNNEYEIKENFTLAPLKRNHCKITRCLQYKVSFSQIPLLVSKGLIGIEDYRFLEHHGVDPVSILRAIIYDIKAGKLVQGGSTLTQQLAKNLFFTNEKSFTRKIKEAVISVYLELKYEKGQILQTYFNEVFWGSLQGIRIKGIQAASVIYFGKDVRELAAYEVSILVSMLKGPYYYHPIKRTKRLRKRADFIFNKLNSSGRSAPWSEQQWSAWVEKLKGIQNGEVLEAIYLSSNMKKTTAQYQKYMMVIASKELLKSKEKVSSELSVKMIFGNSSEQVTYYSRFERSLKKAITEEKHQIGSTIKPLIYSMAFDHGASLSDLIDVSPLVMKLKSMTWRPRESHKVKVKKMKIEQALQESLNIPVIRVVEKIGFSKFEESMKNEFPQMKLPLDQYPAQLLGTIELSLSEMYAKYWALIKKECKKPAPNIISTLYDPLRTTIKHSLGRRLRRQKFFGKTGTTNNGYDNWFIGFEGNSIYVIWTGHEGKREANKSLALYGSSTSFKIFEKTILYSGRRLGTLTCNF